MEENTTENYSGSTTGNPAPEPATSESRDDQPIAVLTHLMPLLGQILPAVGGILGPVLWWVLMKEKYPVVESHGKEVINFAISYTIYSFAASILIFVLIGIPLLLVIGVAALVMMIMGAIKASKGELFRYPLTIRLLK